MDILLASAYYLHEDRHEQSHHEALSAVGASLHQLVPQSARLRCWSCLTATFQTRQAFADLLAQEQPPVVGFYCNLLTKLSVLAMIREAKQAGAIVVVGGPDPPFYAQEYLQSGADVVVIGEGELTLEELLPHLARSGPRNMSHIMGIAYREEDGQVIQTPARPYIEALDDMPHPDRAAVDMQSYLRAWRERHSLHPCR